MDLSIKYTLCKIRRTTATINFFFERFAPNSSLLVLSQNCEDKKKRRIKNGGCSESPHRQSGPIAALYCPYNIQHRGKKMKGYCKSFRVWMDISIVSVPCEWLGTSPGCCLPFGWCQLGKNPAPCSPEQHKRYRICILYLHKKKKKAADCWFQSVPFNRVTSGTLPDTLSTSRDKTHNGSLALAFFFTRLVKFNLNFMCKSISIWLFWGVFCLFFGGAGGPQKGPGKRLRAYWMMSITQEQIW